MWFFSYSSKMTRYGDRSLRQYYKWYSSLWVNCSLQDEGTDFYVLTTEPSNHPLLHWGCPQRMEEEYPISFSLLKKNQWLSECPLWGGGGGGSCLLRVTIKRKLLEETQLMRSCMHWLQSPSSLKYKPHMAEQVHIYLRNTAGLVPDHRNKVSQIIFWFPSA